MGIHQTRKRTLISKLESRSAIQAIFRYATSILETKELNFEVYQLQAKTKEEARRDFWLEPYAVMYRTGPNSFQIVHNDFWVVSIMTLIPEDWWKENYNV